MKQEIIKVMIKEHEVIESLLNDFERQFNTSPKSAKRIFQAFVWNLEKHMFLEEKFMYTVNSVWNFPRDEIFGILSDHGDIISLVKKIQNSRFESSDIYELREMIRDHFVLEETVLYPNLEKALNNEQKEIFLERAQEVILG